MLTGTVVFLLLLIGLLAIPVTLTFQVSRQQAFQGVITLLWLFGRVRVQRSLFQSKVSLPKAEEPVQKTSRSQRSSGKKSNVFAAISGKTFRRRLIRFINDFWHAIHKENVRLRIRIGLGDPADTGQLWAIVGPVAGALASIQEASIEIEPEFFDASFELDSSGKIRLIPMQMIYLAVGLLLSPSFWYGVKQMRVVEP